MRKIGIDAKWFINGNPSGKVVIRNILIELVKINYSDEYIYFFTKRDLGSKDEVLSEFADISRVRLVFIPTCVNFLSNMIVMPYYANKLGLDVCLYQNYAPITFKKKTKNVLFIHDFLFLDYPEYFSPMERTIFRLMRFTAKFAYSIITISKTEKDRIERYLKSEKKINVVYHGISDDFKPALQEDKDEITLQFNLPEKYILYLGRINIRKNIKVLLEALTSIDEHYSLVIIGKKDHKTFDINKEIQKLNIQNRVHILGHLSYSDLLKVIRSANLFVFPSFAEGFGLPPLEAMKSGIPTIVSNATCLPEICGNAALYFNPERKDDLIKQINIILSSDEIRIKYINLGLSHSKSFTWKKSATKILNILLETVN